MTKSSKRPKHPHVVVRTKQQKKAAAEAQARYYQRQKRIAAGQSEWGLDDGAGGGANRNTSRKSARIAKVRLNSKRKKNRAKKPVVNGTTLNDGQKNACPNINWIIPNNKRITWNLTKSVAEHVRHSLEPPTVVFANERTPMPDKHNRDVWFQCDEGQWWRWFQKRPSKIHKAGYGLFAWRNFTEGMVITRYLGRSTTNRTQSNVMQRDKDTKGYVVELNASQRNKVWVGASKKESFLYAHLLNDSSEPNCVIDRRSGVIRTRTDVRKGEELTLDYGKDYPRPWIKNKH